MEGLHVCCLCLCKNAKLAHHIARNSWSVTPLQQCRQVTIEDQQHHWGKESMCTLPGGPQIFSRLFNHICGLLILDGFCTFDDHSSWAQSHDAIHLPLLVTWKPSDPYPSSSTIYTPIFVHIAIYHTYTKMEWWVIDVDKIYSFYASCAPPHVSMVNPRSMQLDLSNACPSDHVLRQGCHQLELSLQIAIIGCMMEPQTWDKLVWKYPDIPSQFSPKRT